MSEDYGPNTIFSCVRGTVTNSPIIRQYLEDMTLETDVRIVDPENGEVVCETGQVPPEDIERVLRILDEEDCYERNGNVIYGACSQCGKLYSECESDMMLKDMFGKLEYVDEDYLVLNWGLCPQCWPEYPG